MAQNTADDPRSDEMKIEMAEHFAEHSDAYREGDFGEVVYEDSQVILFEDTKGHEFSEWDSEFGPEFGQMMHDLADQLVDRDWPASYPLVFNKLEGDA